MMCDYVDVCMPFMTTMDAIILLLLFIMWRKVSNPGTARNK